MSYAPEGGAWGHAKLRTTPINDMPGSLIEFEESLLESSYVISKPFFIEPIDGDLVDLL